jgi:hypothetical protein
VRAARAAGVTSPRATPGPLITTIIIAIIVHFF